MFNFSDIVNHKLFRNVFVYTNFSVIRKAVPFLLLPVLTRYLTPADYGILATFQVLFAMAVVFVGLNMHGAVSVNYFKIEKHEFKVYIGNVFLILFVSFNLTFLIVYVSKSALSHLTKFPENWVMVTVLAALCQFICTLILTLWQVEQKPMPYGLFQLFQTVLNVIISLIFVVLLGWQWQGRLLGIIVVSIISAMISIIIIFKRKYISFSFNIRYIKDALYFGIPLIPHALGWWLMTSIDRLFINSMVNVAATGMYTVGYQVGMIIGLLATSFNQAWHPFLFKKLKANNYSTKIKIVKFTYMYNMGIIILAVTLSLVAPWFLGIFVGKGFHGAYKYVLWIAFGYAFQGMYFMVVNYIFYIKKTYILAWVTFFSACVNMFLNYFLIKANGAVGAAQATTITFFVQFIIVWILSAKVYEMPWFLKNKIKV